MPNSNVPLTEFKNLSETDRSLIVWQALTDIWTKLNQYIDFQKVIEADTRVHEKLLITGNGEPGLLERMRTAEKFINGVWKIAWIFIGAIVVQIVAFGFMAVWVVARIYPILEKLSNQP